MRQNRNKAVQLAVETNLAGHLGPEEFQSAVMIMELEPHNGADRRVEDPAGVDLVPRIEPPSLPAIDDVETLAELRQHPRNLSRVVLQIGVDHEDQIALGRTQTGCERGRFAEIATEADSRDPGIAAGQVADRLPRVVGRTVVDKNNLDRLAQAATTSTI